MNSALSRLMSAAAMLLAIHGIAAADGIVKLGILDDLTGPYSLASGVGVAAVYPGMNPATLKLSHRIADRPEPDGLRSSFPLPASGGRRGHDRTQGGDGQDQVATGQ
jgi:hypothetical protein